MDSEETQSDEDMDEDMGEDLDDGCDGGDADTDDEKDTEVGMKHKVSTSTSTSASSKIQGEMESRGSKGSKGKKRSREEHVDTDNADSDEEGTEENPNLRKRYTEEEIAIMSEMIYSTPKGQQIPWKAISSKLNRPTSSIKSKFKHMKRQQAKLNEVKMEQKSSVSATSSVSTSPSTSVGPQQKKQKVESELGGGGVTEARLSKPYIVPIPVSAVSAAVSTSSTEYAIGVVAGSSSKFKL